jgi:hypothetical protein
VRRTLQRMRGKPIRKRPEMAANAAPRRSQHRNSRA